MKCNFLISNQEILQLQTLVKSAIESWMRQDMLLKKHGYGHYLVACIG